MRKIHEGYVDGWIGHEVVGVVAAIGKDVKSFTAGERVVADNSVRVAAVWVERAPT
jgi:threonine dehydrogenase-like Zn-dependent dehydrogenase